jgi:7-cyano-7-deazaguanine synthase
MESGNSGGVEKSSASNTAIVLLSGGIDSCVALAQALALGRGCTTLSFDYGQRHRVELKSAKAIAEYYNVPHKTIKIDSVLFADNTVSALVRRQVSVAAHTDLSKAPSTYVPCRNLLFLAHAASMAESLNAHEIWIGANADDVPSYPDCAPSF